MFGAYPLGSIERRSEKEDFRALKALVEQHGAKLIVAGLPLNLDGSVGPAARYAQRFAARLEAALKIPVELFDERLTTFEARSRLAELAELSGRRRAVRRSRLDTLAAVVILESWLAARK